VWNPSQRSHGAYFLYPFTNYQGKRISYAPCCAMKYVDSSHVLPVKEGLLRFNSISVRNIETQEFVWDSIGLKPEIVVDPTLLVDVDFTGEEKMQQKPDYILAYILGTEIKGGHSAIISEIKNQYGDLPVYAIILSENKPQYFSWANKSYWAIGPAEWVMLFKNARYIYTDSYHGLLFALKYKKPFLSYYAEEARASRFIDLSIRYKLDTFIVNSVTDAIRKEAVKKFPNYIEITSLLSHDIKKSAWFLKNAIEN